MGRITAGRLYYRHGRTKTVMLSFIPLGNRLKTGKQEPSMIIYQVTVHVDRDREEEWQVWMRDHHIGDVLATGYFTRADFEQAIGEEGERTTYQIRYHAETLEQYQTYAREAAAPLQKDHADRFGDCVSASRTLWQANG
jgi:hypothetical protein